MLKSVYDCRGSISIFLVLIMLPMFVCAGLCVDASKVAVAKSSISGAGDLAMNAALSEYDNDLKELYGLFANSENMKELQENVTRYFENTINGANVLDSADSYTRNFVDSIIANMFTGGETDFNNVVVTRVDEDSFKLSAIEQSAIAKPDIMKRQILDYMQYKAPVNLGKGLLTKLGCIGDVSKQSSAMEKQIDYQEDLKKVDDVCRDSYDAIKTYNETYGNNYADKSGTQIIEEVRQSIQDVKVYYQQMAQYKIADNSVKIKEVKSDSKIKKALEKTYSKDDTITDKLDKVKRAIDAALGINSEYNFDFLDFCNGIQTGCGGDLESELTYIQNFNSNADTYCYFYTYIDMYKDLYETLKKNDEIDEETKENYKYLYKIGTQQYTYEEVSSSIKNKINSAQGTAQTIKNGWNGEKGKISYWCERARNELKRWTDSIQFYNGDIIKELDDAIKKLDKIEKQLQNVGESKTKWKGAIDNLSDGTVKSTMLGDYEGSAKELNINAIHTLQARLEKNKTFFETLKGRIEGIKLAGHKVINLNSSYFINIKTDAITYSNISALAANYVNENYQIGSGVDGIDTTNVGKITSDDTFYAYLEKNFHNSEKAEDEQTKQAKANRKEIVDKGNTGAKSEVQETSVLKKEQLSSAYNNNDAIKELNTALHGLSQKGSDSGIEGIDADDSSKCKANLSRITTLFEKLKDLLTNARDNLYLEEYMTEIFSCYTDTLDGSKVSSINPQNKLNEHVFYGSEVEYLIFGKETPQGNLNAAKGLLFALRLVLNTIYAFTASDIRGYTLSMATAIAGWTGFGVPIVQTILTFALGMAESVIDVNALCEGDSVALYKNKNTWVLSPTGLANNLKNTLEEKAKGVANEIIDNVTEKIEQCADNSLESLLGDDGAVTKYIDTTTQTITDKVKDSVISPLQTQMSTFISNDKDLDESTVQTKFKEILNKAVLGAYSDDSHDSVLYKATKKAVEYVETNCLSDLAHFTVEKYNQYKNEGQNVVNSITKQIEDKMTGIAGQVSEKAKEAVSSLNASLQNAIGDAIHSGSTTAKQKINDAISDYTSQINKSNKLNTVTGNNTQEGDMSASGSGFTMNYKEYMKVFCVLYLMSNQEGMLNRTAQLIQANLAGKNSSTNLAKAYTMLEVSAKIKVKTAFLDVVSASGSELDYSNLGKGYRTIQYKSAYGY